MRARELMTAGLIVVVAGLVLAGCGSDDKKESSSDTTEATTATTTASGAGAMSANVVTKDFQFEPATLTAKAGQAVTVTIKNEGQAEHNFSITSLNVNKDVEPGKTETVTFTPASAGNVEFFCEYHKTSKNMVGSLTVT